MPHHVRRFCTMWIGTVFAAALLSYPSLSAAQTPPTSDAPVSTSALINQQLDHRITLTLDGALTDSLHKIQAETGVSIAVDPLVYDALPWGGDTTIKANFKNVLLRKALDEI